MSTIERRDYDNRATFTATTYPPPEKTLVGYRILGKPAEIPRQITQTDKLDEFTAEQENAAQMAYNQLIANPPELIELKTNARGNRTARRFNIYEHVTLEAVYFYDYGDHGHTV